MDETPSSMNISTKLERIANIAKENPGAALTALAHHIDIDWLREAHRRTRKNGARGVDGTSAEQYAQDLEGNLRSLLDRAKSGAYVAPPVRRVHIPKGDGTSRPIGIPAFEDKVLQRAVAMVLEAVYEPSFYDFSYGFRPRKSAHDALEMVRRTMTSMRGGWIVEVDIRKFFDTLDHGHLREILRRRIRDGVLLRLIGKWLNAGVLDGTTFERPEEGTPQGGVISPLLANIYLHEVIDAWFVRDLRPRLKYHAAIVRYADDVLMMFRDRSDAKTALRDLSARLGAYGLSLHPEKTRLVAFRHPADGGNEGNRPGTFDLLGFTHFWGRSRTGTWSVMRKTAKDRLARSLRRIKEWCSKAFHWSLSEQHTALSQKLRGHYAYFGITPNYRALSKVWHHAKQIWKRALSNRSRASALSWEAMYGLLARFPLPAPRIVHSRA